MIDEDIVFDAIRNFCGKTWEDGTHKHECYLDVGHEEKWSCGWCEEQKDPPE